MGQELYALGRAAHPDLRVPPAAFAARLSSALGNTGGRSAQGIAVADLYLACACTERVPGAAEAFRSAYQTVIRRAVARVLTNPADREEATQRALDALLVGGGTPKLGQYLGQGALASWIAVVALREAISMGRAETSERRLRQKAAAEAIGVATPELSYMKRELRLEIEAAVADALRALPDRERLVLRLYLVSGLSLAAISKSFDVSAPTVSRWLARAREAILTDVQRRLGDRLRLARPDLESFARLVMSELDVSISRLLGAA